MTLGSDVIDKLAELGDDVNFSPTSDQSKAVSRFVMLLYAKRQDDRVHVPKMADVGDLRWRLYSKHQKETENLPPTPSTLNRHVQRANYVLRLWKLSTTSFRPQLPDIKDHGWNIVDNLLCPIMTDELPAPQYSIEMVNCSCKFPQSAQITIALVGKTIYSAPIYATVTDVRTVKIWLMVSKLMRKEVMRTMSMIPMNSKETFLFQLCTSHSHRQYCILWRGLYIVLRGLYIRVLV